MLQLDISQEELVNSVNRLFRKFEGIDRALQDATYISKSIQGVIDAIVPTLFSNLVVSTMDFNIIGQSDNIEKFFTYISSEDNLREFVEYMNTDTLFAQVQYLREPFLYHTSLFPDTMICVNVFYQTEPVCRIVHYNSDNSLRKYDKWLLSYIAQYVQSIYEITGGNEEILPQDQLQHVLMRLMDRETVSEELISTAMMNHGWGKDGAFLSLCILPGSHNQYGTPYYCKLLSDGIRGSISFISDSYVACIISLDYYKNDPLAFRKETVEFFRDNIFRVGISNIFYGISELYPYWKQSMIALTVGMDENPYLWNHSFSEQIESYLISKCLSELPAKYLVAPELLLLQKYDTENNTEYYETLRIYLRNSMNALQTAKDLFIVRGTMNFRLNRLKKITGLDFHDPDVRVYLELSYRLLKRGQAL